MIAAALFDWDGTLSDSRAALLASFHESTEAVLGRRYPADAAEENAVFTQPGMQIWRELASDPGEVERLAESFQASYAGHSTSIRAFPGIAEMLDAVRSAGIRTGVVTSKARRRFGPDAERVGLAALIDVAVCGDEAPPKPDPAALLEALRRLAVAPSEAAMVGDTDVDVAAARAAGIMPIGVAWGHSGERALRDAGARIVVRNTAELTPLLTGAIEGRVHL